MIYTFYNIIVFVVFVYKNKDLLMISNRILFQLLSNINYKRILNEKVRHQVKNVLIGLSDKIKIIENYI